jgi:hypothetical protein
MNVFLQLLAGCLGLKWADGLSNMLAKDYRHDPVYKKNVQDLIERNKRFEKTE